jgi:hypothetical protein
MGAEGDELAGMAGCGRRPVSGLRARRHRVGGGATRSAATTASRWRA